MPTNNPRTRTRGQDQVTANIGVFYTAFKLSELGWNVLITVRNSAGPDLFACSSDLGKKLAIQVKTAGGGKPDLHTIPGGSGEPVGDLLIVVRISPEENDLPRCFIYPMSVAKGMTRGYQKDGKVSFWIQPRKLGTENQRYLEAWPKP